MNNDLIDPFEVTAPCWWAKQRALQKEKKKKISINNRTISQKWNTPLYTYKKKSHNKTTGSLWWSLRSPDNITDYWHLTDKPTSTVWEKRALGITENDKNCNEQLEAQNLTVRPESKTDVCLRTKKETDEYLRL